MFAEINDLKVAIIKMDPTFWSDMNTLLTLASDFRCVFLADKRDTLPITLLPFVPVLYEQDFSFVNLYPSMIKRALELLNAEPYEAVYLTDDPICIREVATTRCATVLVGNSLGGISRDFPEADVWVPNVSHARSALLQARQGHPIGLLGEALAYGEICGGSPGYVNIAHSSRYQGRRDTRVAVLGRYFPTGDDRHYKHPYTGRILKMKLGVERVLARAFSSFLLNYPEYGEVDLITTVPPKPGKRHQGLSLVVRKGCEIADRSRGNGHYAGLYRSDVLMCPDNYPDQKSAGSFSDRRANVHDRYRSATLANSPRVLLVDDIIHSGNTVFECADQMRSAGAFSVQVVAFGHNQQVITTDENRRLRCPKSGCDGALAMRINNRDGGAFLGCPNYKKCGFRGASALSGLQQWNALNTRGRIELFPDIAF